MGISRQREWPKSPGGGVFSKIPPYPPIAVAWYKAIDLSPTQFYGNKFIILTGTILSNNENGLLMIGHVIAICDRILYKEYSKWTLDLIGVLSHFMKLRAVFINQSNQLGNICCVKHLILNSVTIIMIFVMTLLFYL